MAARQVSLDHEIPYGGWLQSFQGPGSLLRTTSESDTRFNGFTLLTAGFTMLNYFMYHNATSDNQSTLLDGSGNPTTLYHQAAAANLEYANIGKSLRYLVSSDVGFVSGGLGTAPSSLDNWAPGDGGENRLLSISIANADTDPFKNGLIGHFTDDQDQNYFMLTNLYHGATLSAVDASLDFTLTFDNTVDSIWLLNRTTGLAEEIALLNTTALQKLMRPRLNGRQDS